MYTIPQALPFSDFEIEYERPALLVTRQDRLKRRKAVIGARKWSRQVVPRHVYFVQAADRTGPMKIGSAFDIELRLEQLQLACPWRLIIVGHVLSGGEGLERKLHRHFRAQRSHGEWFRVTWDQVVAGCAEVRR